MRQLKHAFGQESRYIRLSNTGLQINGTGQDFALTVKPGSAITASRTLTLTTGDADRTVTLNGNPTLNDWFDQSVKTTASVNFADVTTTGNVVVGNNVQAASGSAFKWNTRSVMVSGADGVITLSNNAQTDFSRLTFGGTSSSFPALKRSSTTVAVRLADDSADAPITASAGTFSTTLSVTGDVTVNTNKFTVTASSGNTVIAGTLAVTGAITASAASALTLDNASGVITLSGSTTPELLFSGANARMASNASMLFVIDKNNDGAAESWIFRNNNTTDVFTLTEAGILHVNDSSNANMTTGVTINQGGADDDILAFKSSDVTHGMTALDEADTYASFVKYHATQGGVSLFGYTTATVGIQIQGRYTTDDTTKTTGGSGAVVLIAQKKSGSSVSTPGADANLVTIAGGGSTRFIFDNEGSAHADVEWITFDSHNDVALLDTLDTKFSRRDAVTNAFGEVLLYNADALQDAGIVNFYDDGPRAMVNFTRLAMLHTGAIRQLARRNYELERRLEVAERKLLSA